ncbi:MAG: amidohydrolase family protein [Cyclobacteriaceae bacterium]
MKRVFENLLILLVIGSIIACSKKTLEVDTLIRQGKIIDGTNGTAYVGDIGISGDTISFIGNSENFNVKASKVVNASGLTVSPGFIDPHTHAWVDLRSEEANQNINYLTQGVTTVFAGNDGGGPFDIDAAAGELNLSGIGTNVVFLVGHGSVRREILGMSDVAPTEEQLESMKALVRKGMETGAFGFSTGLYYAPGSFSTTEEVIELTKEVAAYDGVYDSHIRDESSYNIGLIGAVKETIEIGEKSGVPIHFAHIKALGVDVWGKSTEIIQLVEEAQSRGLRVTADQYPWRASGTNLQNAVISRWVMAGGEDAYYKRLNDPKLLPRIRAEIKENIRKRGGPESLLITADYKDEEMIGLNLGQIAEQMKLDPVEATLVIAKNGGARVASFNMNEDDMKNFMTQDWVMTSSDGSKGHPRKYASFPEKYLRYVIENPVLSLETFVHKSSALPSSTFGIEKRGTIKVGNYADVILFDEDRFRPLANFSEPENLSEGVEYVFVNGEPAILEGKPTPMLSGKVLRKNK